MMVGRTARRLTIAALISAGASTAGVAQQKVPQVEIESVLTRSLIERAAFHACAALGPEPVQTAEMIARTWRFDLAETAELLKGAGYPEDFVGTLTARLDLQSAAPKFSERAALEAYCSVLGDWWYRMTLFRYSVPKLELPKDFKR